MSQTKPQINQPVGPLSLTSIDGGRVTIGGVSERWVMLFVYRGRHCPRCKRYLNKLNEILDKWQALLDVIVVSADSKEKAIADRDQFGWQFLVVF